MSRRPGLIPGIILQGLTIFVLIMILAGAAGAVDKAGRALLPATAPDPYAIEPKPMTVEECGRCHLYQFETLKEEGGAHRFDCKDCHEVFHAYNPRKENFAELMPKCGNCHDLPHGEIQTDCLSCHENPHAPKLSLSMQKLAVSCVDCHRQPAEQLQDFPSAHSAQNCQDCHSERHGRIPTCFECHEAHFPNQTLSACLECHPVHKPRETVFEADTDSVNCAACHDKVYLKWSKTPSRHGQVNCTVCHSRHGYLPACTDCHQPPHPPQMTARFKSCLGCHFDPHDLPVK